MRKENEQSIWRRLTPEKALDWAERILRRIEEGTLNSEIYGPLVDRLMTFSDNGGGHQESPKATNDLPTSQPLPAKTPHRQGIAQLPPAEKRAYLARTREHWQRRQGRR